MSNKLTGRERIKSRKDFDALYSEGKAFFSSDRKFKGIIIVQETDAGELKIAAVAPGKTGNAVWRNRTKRLIKDIFRTNKQNLLAHCIEKNKSVRLIISPNSLNQKNNDYLQRSDIEQSIVDLLKQAKKKI